MHSANALGYCLAFFINPSCILLLLGSSGWSKRALTFYPPNTTTTTKAWRIVIAPRLSFVTERGFQSKTPQSSSLHRVCTSRVLPWLSLDTESTCWCWTLTKIGLGIHMKQNDVEKFWGGRVGWTFYIHFYKNTWKVKIYHNREHAGLEFCLWSQFGGF